MRKLFQRIDTSPHSSLLVIVKSLKCPVLSKPSSAWAWNEAYIGIDTVFIRTLCWKVPRSASNLVSRIHDAVGNCETIRKFVLDIFQNSWWYEISLHLMSSLKQPWVKKNDLRVCAGQERSDLRPPQRSKNQQTHDARQSGRSVTLFARAGSNRHDGISGTLRRAGPDRPFTFVTIVFSTETECCVSAAGAPKANVFKNDFLRC